jgi:hypothetical protein
MVFPRRPADRLASNVVLALTSCGALLVSGVSTLTSCGEEATPGAPTDSVFSPPDGGTSSSSASSSSSGFQTSGGLLPDAAAPFCVSKQADAIEGKRPVDIILAVDNSFSMREEIAEIEKQINTNFASIIDASNADYRVIVLSRHGEHGADAGTGDGVSQGICVQLPLSGTSCAPVPAKAAETTKFFHHDVFMNSTNAFCQILLTFNAPDDKGAHPQGWAALLRPSAFKVFAIITDDRVKTSCSGYSFDDKSVDPISGANAAGAFESALFSLSPLHFGSNARRNYVWHSIIGVAPFDDLDLTKPHPTNAPIVTKVCSPGSEAPGTGYQALSKATSGLRYPTCGLDFTTIFRAMAEDVISKTTVACDYAMPANPSGGSIDPATAVVRYTSGASVVDLAQVANASACGPYKFYLEGTRIKLCDDACGVVQNDPAADVKILFGCLPKGGPPQ